MTGGIDVVGLVTGTHFIADIQVAVPQNIAVHIPAEQVLRSKDLYRSLQQRCIMKLDGGNALRSDSPPSVASKPSNELEAENKRLEAENKLLKVELELALARAASLQQVFASFGGQLAGIQGALGRLESKEPSVRSVMSVAMPTTHSVAGDAPVFIPSQIAPKDTGDVSIQVTTSESGESSVSDARTKLREMRRK